MANQQEIDKVARSISFEVEAIPQDNTIQLTSTANTTPLNVRIKVRKKQNAGAAQNAVISIPKLDSPGAAPERVRLVSSDQTIMSFNVYMENEEDDKEPRKVKKGFFDFFKSGTHTTVEDSGRSKSPTTQKTQQEHNASRSPDEKCSEPSMNMENISNKSSHAERKAIKKGMLGKYKPGGCLDPPFGEDRYAYDKKKRASPVQSMPVAGSHDEDLKTVSENHTSMYKKNVCGKKRKDSIDDVINMKQQFKDNTCSSSHTSLLQEENYTVTETFSNCLITYPPAVTVSEQKIHDSINEKNMRNQISNAENNYRSSVQSSAEIYYSPSDRKSSTRSNNEKSKQDIAIGAAALINRSSNTGDDKLLATKTMTSLETNHSAIPSSRTQLKLEGQPLFPSQSANQVTDYFKTIVEELVTQGKISTVSDGKRYLLNAGSKHKDSEIKYNVASQIPLLNGQIVKTTDIVDEVNNESELLAKSRLSSEMLEKLAAYTNKEVSLKSSIKNEPIFSDETYLIPNVMETQPYYIKEKEANLKQPAEENLVIRGSKSSVKSKPTYIDYSEPIPSKLIAIAPTISLESSAKIKASNSDNSNIISNEMSAEIPLLVSSNTCSKNHPICFDNESNIDSLRKSYEPKEDVLMTSMKGQAIYTDDGDLVSNELITKFLPDTLVHPRAGISPKLSVKRKTSHADANNSELVAKISIVSPKIIEKRELLEKVTTTVFDENESATKSYADAEKNVSKYFFVKTKPSGADGSGTEINKMQPENKSIKNYQIAKSHLPKEVSIKSSSKSQLDDTDDSYILLIEIPSEISSVKQVMPELLANNKRTCAYESNTFQQSEFTTLSPTTKLVTIPSKKNNHSDADASELIPGETAVQDLLKTTERRQPVTEKIPDKMPAETRRTINDNSMKNMIDSSNISANNKSSYESIPRKITEDTLVLSNLSPKSKFSCSSDNEILQNEIHKITEYSSNTDAKELILDEMTTNIPITKEVSMKTSTKCKSSYFNDNDQLKKELNLQTLTLSSDFIEKSKRVYADANGTIPDEICLLTGETRSKASKRKPSSNFDKELISVELIGNTGLPITMHTEYNEIVKENKISPITAKIKSSSANNTENIIPIRHNELINPSFDVSSKLSTKSKPDYGSELISGETPTNSSKTSMIIQPIYANDSDAMQHREKITTPTGISMKTESLPSFADDNKSIQINTKKPYMKSRPSYTEDNKFITDGPTADLNMGEKNEYSIKVENYDSKSILNQAITEIPLNKDAFSKAEPENKASHMNASRPAPYKLTIKTSSREDVTKTSETMISSYINAINSIPNDNPTQIYSMIPSENQSYVSDTKISPIRDVLSKSSVRIILSQDHCIQTKDTTKSPSTKEITSISEANFATDSNAISIELTVEGTVSKVKRDHSYDKSIDTNKVKTIKMSARSKPSFASYRQSINETKRDEKSEKIKLVQCAKNDSSKSSIKRLFGYADAHDSLQNKLMAFVSSKSSAKSKLCNADNRKSITENLTSNFHVPAEDDTVRDRGKGSAKEFGNSQASFSNTNKSVIDRLPQSRELFSFDLSVERTLEGKNEVQKGRSVSTPSLSLSELIESDIKDVHQHNFSEMYIYDSQIKSILEVKKESHNAYAGSIASTNTQLALLEPNMHANVIISKSNTPKYLTDAIKSPVAEPLIILGQDSYLSKDKTNSIVSKNSLNKIIAYPNENLYDETFKLVQNDLENSRELIHGSHKMLSEISNSVLNHQVSKTAIANNTPSASSLSKTKIMSKTGSFKLRDGTTSPFSKDSKYTKGREILKTDTRKISSVSKIESDHSIVMDDVNLKIKPQIPNNEIIQDLSEGNTTGTENSKELFQSRDSLKSPLLLDQLTTDGEDFGIQHKYDFQLEKSWTASKEDHSAEIKNKDMEDNMPTTIPALSKNETSRTDTSKDTLSYSQPASIIIKESIKSLNSSSLGRDLVESFMMFTNGNNIKTLSEMLGTDNKQKPDDKIKREVLKSTSDPLQDTPEDLYHKQVTELERKGKVSEPFEFELKSLERVSRELSCDTPNQTLKLSATKIDDFYTKQVNPSQSCNFLSSLRKLEDSTTSLFLKGDDKRLLLESAYKSKSNDKDDTVLKAVENKKGIAKSYTSLSALSIYLTDKSEDLRKVYASQFFNNARYAKSISQSDVVWDDTHHTIIKLEDTIKDKSVENKEDIYKTPKARVNMKIKSGSLLSPSNFNMRLRDNERKSFDHVSHRSVDINQHTHNTAQTPISYYGNRVTQQAKELLSSAKIKLDYLDRKLLAQEEEQRPEIPEDKNKFYLEDKSTDFYDLNIDKSRLKSSIPPSFTYIKDLKIDKRLQPEKDVSESGIVVIDVAFQSYLNSRSERVIKSLNSDEFTHHPDDTMLNFRSALRPSDAPIKIAIDSSTDLILGINRRDLLLRESKEKYNMMSNNETQSHVYKAHADVKPTQTQSKSTAGDARQTVKLQRVLSTVYNNHMVPLQDIIHHLKEDIDALATQQEIFRQKLMINKKSKTIRISHTVKRCGCLRK